VLSNDKLTRGRVTSPNEHHMIQRLQMSCLKARPRIRLKDERSANNPCQYSRLLWNTRTQPSIVSTYPRHNLTDRLLFYLVSE